jgi:hypothetical protein
MHRALAAFNRRAAALPTARPGRSQASAEYAQREGWGGDHRAGHRPCEAGRVERAWSQVARWLAPGRAAPHVAGYPTSPNRASSLHLRWELPAAAGPVVAAAVVLVVEAAPPVPDLYFWALQAAFVDGAGRHHGGGHSGLQWHRAHPDSRAVNWGGNGPDGRTLDGSASSLPSATGNANTRDLWWQPGQPSTLTIERAAGGGWAGTADGLRVRTLAAGGDRLDTLMVWSEVFARCDAPAVAVRWSGFRATTTEGRIVTPVAVHVNYQRRAQGAATTRQRWPTATPCARSRAPSDWYRKAPASRSARPDGDEPPERGPDRSFGAPSSVADRRQRRRFARDAALVVPTFGVRVMGAAHRHLEDVQGRGLWVVGLGRSVGAGFEELDRVAGPVGGCQFVWPVPPRRRRRRRRVSSDGSTSRSARAASVRSRARRAAERSPRASAAETSTA